MNIKVGNILNQIVYMPAVDIHKSTPTSNLENIFLDLVSEMKKATKRDGTKCYCL